MCMLSTGIEGLRHVHVHVYVGYRGNMNMCMLGMGRYVIYMSML